MKKMKRKKILIAATAVILAAATGAIIWFSARSGGDPVGVYSFEHIGMTEYWGDSQESYGPVTTDRIQTVFLSDTQTVTNILVNQGDQVKKGDTLMTFDTTLSDLQLERKRLEVEKLKLQLDEAEKTLQKIRQMVPMEPMDDLGYEEEPSQEFLGEVLTESYRAYITPEHDGSTMAKAFICRIRDDKYIDDVLLETLRREVWGDEGICEHDLWSEYCEECNPVLCEHGLPLSQCALCTCPHGADCQVCHPTICTHGIPRLDCPTCSPDICEHGEIAEYCELCNCEHGFRREDCPHCGGDPEQPTESIEDSVPTADTVSSSGAPYFFRFLSSTAETAPSEEGSGSGGSIFSYFVIFKSTEGNLELGDLTRWQGVHVIGQGQDFNLTFFDPVTADYSLPETEEEETVAPSYDYSVGYTAKQILEMRREQEKKISDLEFQIKVADNAYKIMLKEINDGNICAEFDGEVVSLIAEADARATNQPIIKVSGGGGFYIEGSVSELEKDRLLIGQEVTVSDWRTGGTYTGTVHSIGDFPSTGSGWNGMGNPTATYFPFTVFVDGDANLQAGSYVSIQYSAAESNHGVYLEKAFIRTEKGESYVYVLGAGGRLEKRTVTTGKSLWGSYLEVLSGVTAEDLIAFPYGKDVKEGARAEEQDIGSLYGY